MAKTIFYSLAALVHKILFCHSKERPWISKAIMHSIRQRHKLVKTKLYSTDPGKVKEYKAYSNKLNRIIHAAKKNYFSKQFELNKENIKCTWNLISKVIRTKKENTKHTITKLLRDNRIYIDKQSVSICDQLRPRPHVSGDFCIRKFFYADTPSVHTCPPYTLGVSGDFCIRSPEWKFLYTLCIRIRVDARIRIFLYTLTSQYQNQSFSACSVD